MLLDLPAFLFAVFVMYWSLPLACLTYRIRFLTLGGRRDDMFRWAEFLVHFFGVTLVRVGDGALYRDDGPVLYLCNHRSWADFFLDEYITEAEAAPLSRWAVFYAFPIFLTSAIWMHGVIFFKRMRLTDKDAFNARLERKVLASYNPGLVVYPEGHRNLAPQPLPLRRGMLHFAFDRKWPVQIIITRGKERLLSEKRRSAEFGVRLACGFAPVVHSSEFETFDAFAAKVQAEWDALWPEVYDRPHDAAPLLRAGAEGVRGAKFPTYRLVGQALICSASIVLLLGLLLLVARWALASAAGRVAAVVLAATLATSLHRAKFWSMQQRQKSS